MSGLVLKNINKTFPGDQQAIRDFNLEVKDREFLIFAVSSTLLSISAGFIFAIRSENMRFSSTLIPG